MLNFYIFFLRFSRPSYYNFLLSPIYNINDNYYYNRRRTQGVIILSRKTRNLLEYYYKLHTRRQSVGVRYDWRLDANRTIKYAIGNNISCVIIFKTSPLVSPFNGDDNRYRLSVDYITILTLL